VELRLQETAPFGHGSVCKTRPRNGAVTEGSGFAGTAGAAN
jgi:hypothetical protein